MKHIGTLIKSVRESRGCSQEKLANGICSSKYIYLIEKELRTPSSEVLVEIGARLNFDLCDYFPYMDCNDPLTVGRIIGDFKRFRLMKDVEKLEKMTEYARGLVDFQRSPWKSQLDLNDAYSKVVRGDFSEETLAMIVKGIQDTGGDIDLKLKKDQIVSVELLNFYNLLSIYYYMTQNDREGFQYMNYIYPILFDKKEVKRYRELYSAVASNYLNALCLDRQYQRVVDEATDLIQFLKSSNSLERCHMIHFMIAKASDALGNKEMVLKSLKQAIVFCHVYERTEDLENLLKEDFVLEFYNSHAFNVDLTVPM